MPDWSRDRIQEASRRPRLRCFVTGDLRRSRRSRLGRRADARALGIAVPWVFSFMICVLLAGRSLSLIRLSISVAVSQFLFHTLFVLGTVTPSGVATPHVHGAPLVIPATVGVPEAVTADASMWLGHAIAALLTVAALHRGERLVLALARSRRAGGPLAASPCRSCPRASGRPVAGGLRGRFDLERAVGLVLLATLRGRAPPLFAAI